MQHHWGRSLYCYTTVPRSKLGAVRRRKRRKGIRKANWWAVRHAPKGLLAGTKWWWSRRLWGPNRRMTVRHFESWCVMRVTKKKRKTRGIDSWWLGAQHFNSTHSGRSGYLPGLLRGQSLAGPSRRARAPVELTIIHQLWNPCALLKEKKSSIPYHLQDMWSSIISPFLLVTRMVF